MTQKSRKPRKPGKLQTMLLFIEIFKDVLLFFVHDHLQNTIFPRERGAVVERFFSNNTEYITYTAPETRCLGKIDLLDGSL